MGMADYYEVLKVSSAANEEELRRAYKKLAMRWHPDKHPSGAKGLAEAKFKQICEAYDVLSDAQKRQIYDLYGEDGLKYDVSSPSAAAAATRGGGRGVGKGASFKYGNSRVVNDDIFDGFFDDIGSPPKSDNPKKYSENGNRKMGRSDTAEKKAEPLETKLVCSLEELFKGSKRKMKIARLVPDFSGLVFFFFFYKLLFPFSKLFDYYWYNFGGYLY